MTLILSFFHCIKASIQTIFMLRDNAFSNRKIRLQFSLLFFLWMLHPLSSFANIGTSDSVQATIGYGNYVNLGRYTPVTVTIKNNYAASGGTVELNVPTNTDDHYSYQKPYPSSPGTVRVTFCVPLSNFNDQISILVDNHLDPPQQLLLNYTFPLAEEDPPIFFGILSNDESQFSCFNQLNLSNYNLSSHSYMLSSEEITGNFRYLDNFDCIVIDDFSLSSLYESQRNTLKDWVYHGGILLVSNQVEDTDLLLSSSDSNTTYTSIPEFDQANNNAGLEYYSHGNGRFILSNFSLASIETSIVNDQILQDKFIELLFGDHLLQSLENTHFSQLNSLQSEASALTSQVQASTKVNVLLYGTILVVYLLVLLPIIYHQLKKHDLISYFRFALPILSIAIASFIFLLGSSTRFSYPFLTYVSIQEYDSESVKESLFTGIQAPYNRSYSVSLDNSYQLIPMQSAPNEASNYASFPSNHQIRIEHRTDDYFLTFENLVAFTMRNFELEKTSFLTQNQSAFGDIQYYDNTILGTITNKLGFDLNHAILVLPGYFVSIGNLANEDSILLNECNTQMNLSNQYCPPDPTVLSPIIDPSSPSHSSTNMKSNLLNYYLKQCDVSGKNNAYLIGFKDTNPDIQVNTDYSMNGLTLVSVPISFRTNNQKQYFYPSLPAKTYNISGDFSEDGYAIYSHFATVRYDISNDTSLNKLNLFFLESIDSKSYPYVSKVYFWRQDKSEYEQVYPGKTTFTNEELKTYITSDNSLLVQYYTENNFAYLPRITATGGMHHANHP